MSDVYLASQSPRRAELLQQIGISFECLPIDIDESRLANESPLAMVARLARQKCDAGRSHPNKQFDLPVIASDTMVLIDEHILGKPKDEEDACRMLRLLSGRTHQVVTAVHIQNQLQSQQTLVVSDVTFSELSDAHIKTYWQSGEPIGKAGAYAIQGLAAVFVQQLSGSYSAVMGLPLFETAQCLAQFGIDGLAAKADS